MRKRQRQRQRQGQFIPATNSVNKSFIALLTEGPKFGVSNERFSAKVKLRCKLDIHTSLLSPPVYLRRIKISNVLKNFPRFRAVPLGLRYQGVGSSDNLSVFFIKAEWLGLGLKIYRRICASHSSISSLRLQQR